MSLLDYVQKNELEQLISSSKSPTELIDMLCDLGYFENQDSKEIAELLEIITGEDYSHEIEEFIKHFDLAFLTIGEVSEMDLDLDDLEEVLSEDDEEAIEWMCSVVFFNRILRKRG